MFLCHWLLLYLGVSKLFEWNHFPFLFFVALDEELVAFTVALVAPLQRHLCAERCLVLTYLVIMGGGQDVKRIAHRLSLYRFSD